MNPVETTQLEKGVVSALIANLKDELEPTTGIDILDELIESCTYPGMAGILVCLKLADIDSGITDRIKAAIEPVIENVRQMKIEGLDFEGDIAPVDGWMAFMGGYTASKGPGDNADESVNLNRDKIVRETLNILRGKEAATETETSDVQNIKESRVKKGLSGALKGIDGFVASEQVNILNLAIEEVHKVTDRASRLNNMRDRVEAIYDRLDVKSKCAITVLQELAAVDGCSVGVNYGYELLNTIGKDERCIEQARTELLDDQEVKVLVEVFMLSHFINKAV